MINKKRTITAAEMISKLQADPDFQAKENLRELKRQKTTSALHAAEQPILHDLQNLGFKLNSVWDLVNSDIAYDEALPLLLEHVQKKYPDRVKEGIARALAVPSAKIGWEILISEYDKTSNSTEPNAKMGLAAAIAVISNNNNINELLQLLFNQKHGESRIILLNPLRKSASLIAKNALIELARDPGLSKEISSWKNH